MVKDSEAGGRKTERREKEEIVGRRKGVEVGTEYIIQPSRL
jgi:hypothetical protein